MSADDFLPPSDPPGGSGSEPSGLPEGAQPQSPPLRARVPDHVSSGNFSTGAIVMTGPTEFIIDFLQTIGRPQKVACRVVVPFNVMPQMIEALQTNLNLYRNRFGDPVQPAQQPPNPDARRPTPQEIYDDLKMPDEVLSGTYANGVMIGHGATEFGLDFLTSFFPQSAVSARVFLAAGQVPRLLDSLQGAVKQLDQRRGQQAPGQQAPGQLPPGNLPTGGLPAGPVAGGAQGPNAVNDPPAETPGNQNDNHDNDGDSPGKGTNGEASDLPPDHTP
ncbi:DUF3467 domain-containing protein [Planctomycetes bacterium SV_7m_r]